MKRNIKTIAVIYALLAAAFYALNTPFSKVLLGHIAPTYMAAFLYLGAGAGVGSIYLFRIKEEDCSQRLAMCDLPYTIAMIVLDIIAPIFLMIGIKTGSAANASLLGNFEIVATAVIALLLFKEAISWRLWIAIAFITLSSVALSFEGTESLGFSLGSLFVLLATVCWGLENNCTRKISDKSTYEIVVLKGIFSGGGAYIIARILREEHPAFRYALCAMLLGFVAYGLSIFFYTRAQRQLGAAKTSAYYSAAPFIGTYLACVINGERLNATYFLGLALMLAGTVFVVYDTMVKHHMHSHKHVIVHTHNGTTHTHVITHTHEHNHLVNEQKHGHIHLDLLKYPEHVHTEQMKETEERV